MSIRATTMTRPAIVRTATLVAAGLLVLAGPRPPPPGRTPIDSRTPAGRVSNLEAWHCGPTVDRLLAGEEPETATMLTWGLDDDGDPDEFWGTELLIHDDVHAGQPCPQDPLQVLGDGTPGAYIDVADLGVPMPYVVCHHFDSPNT